MGLDTASGRDALERFAAEQTGARNVTTTRLERLSGGAIQENWAWDVIFDGGSIPGELAAVVRTDAISGVSESLSRLEEFTVIKAVHTAGVTVPEPLWACADPANGERSFFVMRRVSGTAAGHRIARDGGPGGNHHALTRRMGEELARIHSVTPPRAELAFLPQPVPDPAHYAIDKFQGYLDKLPEVYAAIQWGLTWANTHAPDSAGGLVLAHHDYRTGNYMVDDDGLTAILDWEFAGWSDRHEDIGWFCAKCWRFGAAENEAGGIGSREAFYDGYRGISGAKIDPRQVHFWEVMAHVRWAVMAAQQAQRHLSGEETSIELALTGRIVPELELEILMLTEEYDEGRVGS
ncbi:MAG: phosphotransferase family protein [Alphaproteobacteria bacterium]|nr:phosphotransferase family protein [Alphaproteobacteria bacterium]